MFKHKPLVFSSGKFPLYPCFGGISPLSPLLDSVYMVLCDGPRFTWTWALYREILPTNKRPIPVGFCAFLYIPLLINYTLHLTTPSLHIPPHSHHSFYKCSGMLLSCSPSNDLYLHFCPSYALQVKHTKSLSRITVTKNRNSVSICGCLNYYI